MPLSVEAQSATTPVTSAITPVIEQLKATRTPKRDRRLYELGVALFKSIDASNEPDIANARAVMAKAFRVAAEGGVPEAWIDLGRCSWNGWGVPEDREEALAAYKKAAALGSDYGAYIAAYNLYWTFKRYDEAYTYVRQAMNADPGGDAHYLAGLMAYNGRGRPRDVRESLSLHIKAANLGQPDALFELFVYAMQGIGDRSRAIYYLREAANREQPRAMANLGALSATGQHGVERNLEEAVTWYRRAAGQGIGRAAAALGVMALRGEGMPKDADAAKGYFARAEELDFDVESYLKEVGLPRP